MYAIVTSGYGSGDTGGLNTFDREDVDAVLFALCRHMRTMPIACLPEAVDIAMKSGVLKLVETAAAGNGALAVEAIATLRHLVDQVEVMARPSG